MHYGLPTQQLTREDAYCVRLVGTHFLHPHDQSPGGVSLKAKKIAQHTFGVAQTENMAFLLERLPHLRAQVFVDAEQVLSITHSSRWYAVHAMPAVMCYLVEWNLVAWPREPA